MRTYKNISDQPLIVMNVGEIEAGGTLQTDLIIENPNLKLMSEEQPVKKEAKK